MYTFFILALLLSGFVTACGSGGGSSGGEATTRETVTLSGSVADSTASARIFNDETVTARLINFFSLTQSALAQQDGQVLEGILVEAFDGDIKVGEDITDAAGEFLIDNVPCGVPITLIFTFEGNVITLDGISVPCPETGDTGVVSMVVSLNFQQGQGQVDQIEDEEDLQNAAISCEGDEELILGSPEEDFIVDGGGFACMVTTGGCDLEVVAPAVIMENCSTCIDTRGDSGVVIETNLFECFADGDGIRSVGNSEVDITLVGSESDLLISAGEDGVDSRGNSEIEIDGDEDDSNDSDSIITIEGFTSGIVAVGNSETEVDAGFCDITPDIIETGNAEVEIDCEDGEFDDDFEDNGAGENGPPEFDDDFPGNGGPEE